ncbi:hypothetical protein IAU59_001539 [Kwoniella sp. CBS 9459]
MPRPGQAKHRRQREAAQAQALAGASTSASSSSAAATTRGSNANTFVFHHDPYEEEYEQYDDPAGYSYTNGGNGYDIYEIEEEEEEEDMDGNGGDEDTGTGAANATGNGKRQPRAQCLPIGELPLDFDGIPTDGSQYLAMVIKASDELPFVKSVDNPYKKPYGPSMPTKSSGPGSAGGGAGPSRHPALPKESWEELFPTHFRGYKKNVLSRLPPTSPLPYPADYPPLPNANHRSEWYAFVNGYITGKNKNKWKDRATPARPVPAPPPMMDEEEAMNAGPIPVQVPVEAEPDPTADMEMDMDIEEEEVDKEKEIEKAEQEEVEEEVKGVLKRTSQGNERRIGAEREPLVSVLQRLNSTQAVIILSHFAYWISELVNQLPSPIPDSPELLPTQPVDPSETEHNGVNGSGIPPLSTNATRSSARRRDMISSNYFNWVFALLMILDDHLSSDQISILRDLARSSMKVAGYRWVTAVVARDVGDGWVLGGNWKAARDRATGAVPPDSSVNGSSMIGPQIPSDGTKNAGSESESGRGGVSEDVEKKARQENVDDTLAKCWLIVHSVATGWGQRDLLEELETLFT